MPTHETGKPIGAREVNTTGVVPSNAATNENLARVRDMHQYVGQGFGSLATDIDRLAADTASITDTYTPVLAIELPALSTSEVIGQLYYQVDDDPNHLIGRWIATGGSIVATDRVSLIGARRGHVAVSYTSAQVETRAQLWNANFQLGGTTGAADIGVGEIHGLASPSGFTSVTLTLEVRQSTAGGSPLVVKAGSWLANRIIATAL